MQKINGIPYLHIGLNRIFKFFYYDFMILNVHIKIFICVSAAPFQRNREGIPFLVRPLKSIGLLTILVFVGTTFLPHLVIF